MKIKNNAKHVYHIGGVVCLPGAITSGVPDSSEADLKGLEHHLEIIGGAVIIEEKGMTKAELQTALLERGVDYSPTANKAELQALLDGAQ
jgi:hypothetical protein